MEIPDFLKISFGTLNLFSFILGGMWGLCFGIWYRWKAWLVIVGYFACVATYFAAKSGAFSS